jgi:hypothetical protein
MVTFAQGEGLNRQLLRIMVHVRTHMVRHLSGRLVGVHSATREARAMDAFMGTRGRAPQRASTGGYAHIPTSPKLRKSRNVGTKR